MSENLSRKYGNDQEWLCVNSVKTDYGVTDTVYKYKNINLATLNN